MFIHSSSLANIRWKENRQTAKTIFVTNYLFFHLVLKCWWQHVRKQFQKHRQEEFHEGNNNENREWNKPKDISCSPCELLPLPSGETLPTSKLQQQPGTDPHISPQQLKTKPVMLQRRHEFPLPVNQFLSPVLPAPKPSPKAKHERKMMNRTNKNLYFHARTLLLPYRQLIPYLSLSPDLLCH